MRKIIVFNRISLDGAYASADGTMNWFIPDSEITKLSHEMMSPDTVLLGRKTYKEFEGFWPMMANNPDAPKEMRMMGEELNEMNKVVFSRTLKEVTWENSTLMHGDLIDEVKKLKRGKGGDIVIFGSGTIVAQLSTERLIDEYLLGVTPIILGNGKPLFKDVPEMKLELLEARGFSTGNTLIHLRPEPAASKPASGGKNATATKSASRSRSASGTRSRPSRASARDSERRG